MGSQALSELREFVLNWSAPELVEPQPKLVLLNGEMGSGKTTFTTVLAEQLGASDAASPSFAIHSRYEGPRGTIDHFDLDRLKSEEELESIGFWDLLSEASLDPRRFVVIEWAQRLSEFGFPVECKGDGVSAWSKPFRVWRFQFFGSPSWQISIKRLS